MTLKNIYTAIKNDNYGYYNKKDILYHFYYNNLYFTISFDYENKNLDIEILSKFNKKGYYVPIETKDNIQSINVIFLTENIIWIGLPIINDNDKYIYIMQNVESDEFFISTSIFDTMKIQPIGSLKKYWTYEKNDFQYIYEWKYLFGDNDDNIENEIEHYKIDSIDYNYYSVNWNGASYAKIKKNDDLILFLDENLNIIFEKSAKSFFSNYEPIDKTEYNEELFNFISINDNILLYYEGISLEEDHAIIKNGVERKYVYDFTNEKIEEFRNRDLTFYVTYGKPFRDDDGCKLLMNEYYPAGSWHSVYISNSIDQNYIFIKKLNELIDKNDYNKAIELSNEHIRKCCNIVNEHYCYKDDNLIVEGFFEDKLKLFIKLYNNCYNEENKKKINKICKKYCKNICISIMKSSKDICIYDDFDIIYDFMKNYYDFNIDKENIITEKENKLLNLIYEKKLSNISDKIAPDRKLIAVKVQ